MSNLIDFREYIEEQRNLSFGVELGGTPAVVGSIAREYDFILESIDVYLEREHEKHQLNENQQIVLECLKEEGYAKHYIEDVLRDLNNDSRILPNGVYKAYVSLSDKQFLEVLQAFAEWGLSHERN